MLSIDNLTIKTCEAFKNPLYFRSLSPLRLDSIHAVPIVSDWEKVEKSGFWQNSNPDEGSSALPTARRADTLGYTVFRGINSATLDSKGRMALPTRSRETCPSACDGNVVVTIDMRESCLLLYPLPEWESRTTKARRAFQHQRARRGCCSDC